MWVLANPGSSTWQSICPPRFVLPGRRNPRPVPLMSSHSVRVLFDAEILCGNERGCLQLLSHRPRAEPFVEGLDDFVVRLIRKFFFGECLLDLLRGVARTCLNCVVAPARACHPRNNSLSAVIHLGFLI